MSNFRAVLTFAVVGTLLGILLATLTAPTLISGEQCGYSTNAKLAAPCAETVQAATSGLIRYQLYGGLGGTVLGIAAGVFFSLRRKKKLAAAGQTISDAPKV